MSLDLYCGSLAKYYARDFETPQARTARENGLTYRLVYEGEPIGWPDLEDARQRIVAFKEQLRDKNPALGDWSDDADDYCAQQLHRQSLNGLLLACAYHHRPELERPCSSMDDISDDPAYEQALDRNYYYGPLAIFEAQLIVPASIDSLTLCTDPMGWGVVVTTTSNLRCALDWCHKNLWDGETDARQWLLDGPPSGERVTYEARRWRLPWQSKRKAVRENVDPDHLMGNARYAFACFATMLEFSEHHGLPIRQDG